MANLAKCNFAYYDEETDFVWVVEMLNKQLGTFSSKHNSIKAAANTFAKTPRNRFLKPFIDKYKSLLGIDNHACLSREYLDSIAIVSGDYSFSSPMETETETETEIETESIVQIRQAACEESSRNSSESNLASPIPTTQIPQQAIDLTSKFIDDQRRTQETLDRIADTIVSSKIAFPDLAATLTSTPSTEPAPAGEQESHETRKNGSQSNSKSRVAKPCAIDESSPEGRIWNRWRELGTKRSKLPNQKRLATIRTALSNWTEQELIDAIEGIHCSPHNLGANDNGVQYLGIELALRSDDHIERFIAIRERYSETHPNGPIPMPLRLPGTAINPNTLKPDKQQREAEARARFFAKYAEPDVIQAELLTDAEDTGNDKN